jgi:hypothetical protein
MSDQDTFLLREYLGLETNFFNEPNREFWANDVSLLSRGETWTLPWEADRVVAYPGPIYVQREKVIKPATLEDIRRYVIDSPSD